ncbi:MAG: TIGR03936 family radical SAM-associated protein [Butyricicoccaceae bacterium]
MYKVRMRFSKTEEAAYLSHLDLMHTMQRVLARAKLPVWYTEGYNQHIYISVALPLSTCYSGEWEFLDFNLMTDKIPPEAVKSLNAVMPKGLRAHEIYPVKKAKPVRDIAYSQYRITYDFDGETPEGFIDAVRELFAREEIVILKKSKRGEKEVNIKEYLRGMEIEDAPDGVRVTVITAAGNNNLSPEYVTKVIERELPQYSILGADYHRLMVYDADMNQFK